MQFSTVVCPLRRGQLFQDLEGSTSRPLTNPVRASGVRPQLTFLIIVSHECRAYEIVKWELNKFILCDMSAFEQEYSEVFFVEVIGCEKVHFLPFNRRMDLWKYFCYGPRGRMNTWLFFLILTGIARGGVLKELEVCDFDKSC